MYVDSYEFKDWMQKLLDKLEEVGKDVKSLQTNPEVMPNDKLLDNQIYACCSKSVPGHYRD